MNGIPFASYRQLDRRIFVLAGARGINTMGFSIVMPFMAMYLVEQRGVSGAAYGAVYLVAGLAAAIGNAASGEASDRVGRRRVMMFALAARAVNMVLMGTAVVMHAPVVVIGALIVLNAVLRATFEPAASAAVTELVPAERRTAAYGLQRMGVNFGWALGPALGGTLAAAFSYGTLFYVAALVMLAATVAVARVEDKRSLAGGSPRMPRAARRRRRGAPSPDVCPPPDSVAATAAPPPPAPAAPSRVTPPGEHGLKVRPTLAAALRSARENRPLFAYLLLVFLGSTLTVQQFATLSVHAKTDLGLSMAEIGYLYAINGALVVLLQVPAVRAIEAGGPSRALFWGPVLYTVSFVTIGFSHAFGQLAVAMAVMTAGEVVFAPALTDLAARLAGADRLGRTFGLVGLMQQLGLSVGPLVGGLLFDAFRGNSLALWGTIAAAMTLVGCGYALFWRKWRERLG